MRRAIQRPGFLPVTSFRTEDWRDLIQDVASSITHTGLFPVASYCAQDWNDAIAIANPRLFPLASCASVGLTNEQKSSIRWDETANRISTTIYFLGFFPCAWCCHRLANTQFFSNKTYLNVHLSRVNELCQNGAKQLKRKKSIWWGIYRDDPARLCSHFRIVYTRDLRCYWPGSISTTAKAEWLSLSKLTPHSLAAGTDAVEKHMQVLHGDSFRFVRDTATQFTSVYSTSHVNKKGAGICTLRICNTNSL